MGLLQELASWPDSANLPQLKYIESEQISMVYEDGRWIKSWSARSLQGTKKFDVETGEDAKGQ